MARISNATARKLGLAGKRKRTKPTFKATSPIPAMCESLGLPVPVAEYQFDEDREWRFDFAWLDLSHIGVGEPMKLALEIDGGTWTKSRHHHGEGLIEDRAKLNQAVILGWRVLRVGPEDVASGAVYELIRRAIGV